VFPVLAIVRIGRVDRLRSLLATYARSIPDALADAWNSPLEIDPVRVRHAANAELELIGPEDERSRRFHAERAERRLDDEQRIWGGEMPQVVREPRTND
jgi:hypothetical protein